MLTKEECETALSKLWDNTFGTDCITGEDLDKYVDIIDGLIQYVFNPQPYKFEELKPNMWVWDNKLNACFLIKELKPQSYWNIIIYANYLTDTFEEINFEKKSFLFCNNGFEKRGLAHNDNKRF